MEIGTQVKVKQDCSYCFLNEYNLVVCGHDSSLDYPITVRIGDTDSFQWFTEDELQIL